MFIARFIFTCDRSFSRRRGLQTQATTSSVQLLLSVRRAAAADATNHAAQLVCHLVEVNSAQ